MRLTSYTDYTLRTLIYLGMNRDRLVTIQDIADNHLISKNHLMKVVYQLGTVDIVETVRGRNGGLRLKKEPSEINIGEIVRWTETDFHMAECFDRENNRCVLSPSCKLQGVLVTATRSFLNVLDAVTLDELLVPEKPGKKKLMPSPVRIYPSVKAKAKADAV